VQFIDDDLTEVYKPTSEADSRGIFPRTNFNFFINGMVTIFIVFIGEDWNSVMITHVRGSGDTAIPFFVFVFIFGNLILLNLFLAILLKNFEEPPGKDDDEPAYVEEPTDKVPLKVKCKKCCCCLCCFKYCSCCAKVDEED